MLKKALTDVTMISGRDWLFSAGTSTEDGTEIEGVSYFVTAETEDGFRFQHDRNFSTGRVDYQEDGFNFWNHKNQKLDVQRFEAFISRVQEHINKGGKLDPTHWRPIQGCYGSAGWDENAEIELEREEEW